LDGKGAGSPEGLVTLILNAAPGLTVPIPIEDLARQLDAEIPKDHDVLLAVLDSEGFHALEFPCRRSDDGRWIDAATSPLD
jgi:hypothetical protein